jgi:hypothetical protein
MREDCMKAGRFVSLQGKALVRPGKTAGIQDEGMTTQQEV